MRVGRLEKCFVDSATTTSEAWNSLMSSTREKRMARPKKVTEKFASQREEVVVSPVTRKAVRGWMTRPARKTNSLRNILPEEKKIARGLRGS